MSHDSFFFLALWEKSLNCEKKVTIIIFFNPWQKQAFIGLCFTVCSFLSDHKALPVLHKCQSGVVVMCVFVVTVSSSKSDSGSCFPECFAAVVVHLFLSHCGASLLMLMLILVLVFSLMLVLWGFAFLLASHSFLSATCLFFLVSCLNFIKTPAYMHSFHAVPLHRRNLDAPRKVCVSARCLLLLSEISPAFGLLNSLPSAFCFCIRNSDQRATKTLDILSLANFIFKSQKLKINPLVTVQINVPGLIVYDSVHVIVIKMMHQRKMVLTNNIILKSVYTKGH